MSFFASFTTVYIALILPFCCKSQGVINTESIISSRHFIVEIYGEDYEFGNYYCQDDFGSPLASIRSQEEQDEINELIQRVDFSDGENIWIGYTNNGGTTYSWEDSSTSTYTNWCDNQPTITGNFSCAQISPSGCWVDAPCRQYHNLLCRRSNILYSSNSNYLLVQDAFLVYLDAQAFCRDTIGTELATVTTISEHNELLALLTSANHVNPQFYIGLDDRSTEGTLKWQDGTAIDTTFINDRLCETNTNGEDCVYINEQNGCWEFRGCNFFSHFACNNPSTTSSTNYVAVDAKLSFFNANEYCKDEYSSTLATISSSTENSEVFNILYRNSWIGYNDRDLEGQNNFVWLSGTSSYTNWRQGEPNNYQNEDCTIIYENQNVCTACWNDIDCSVRRSFVCNL